MAKNMYQKQKERKEAKANNDDQKVTTTNINCLITVFPILLKNPVK